MKQKIVDLLGSDRTEQIKDALKEIIIDSIRTDYKYETVLTQNDIRNFSEQILKEVKQELRADIKKKVKEAMGPSVEDAIFSKLGIQKPELQDQGELF